MERGPARQLTAPWYGQVTLILFEADLRRMWRERNLKSQGYDHIDEEDENAALSDMSLERLFGDIDENASGEISE